MTLISPISASSAIQGLDVFFLQRPNNVLWPSVDKAGLEIFMAVEPAVNYRIEGPSIEAISRTVIWPFTDSVDDSSQIKRGMELWPLYLNAKILGLSLDFVSMTATEGFNDCILDAEWPLFGFDSPQLPAAMECLKRFKRVDHGRRPSLALLHDRPLFEIFFCPECVHLDLFAAALHRAVCFRDKRVYLSVMSIWALFFGSPDDCTAVHPNNINFFSLFTNLDTGGPWITITHAFTEKFVSPSSAERYGIEPMGPTWLLRSRLTTDLLDLLARETTPPHWSCAARRLLLDWSPNESSSTHRIPPGSGWSPIDGSVGCRPSSPGEPMLLKVYMPLVGSGQLAQRVASALSSLASLEVNMEC